jgi:hypothetical protein
VVTYLTTDTPGVLSMAEPPTGDQFGRRAESLGRALEDLLAGAPDASHPELAVHVKHVTDRLTEDWHAPAAQPRALACIGCGEITDQPTLVRCVETGSGPGGMLYACPTCAPGYGA